MHEVEPALTLDKMRDAVTFGRFKCISITEHHKICRDMKSAELYNVEYMKE